MINKFKRVSSETLFKGHIFDLQKIQIESDTGLKHERMLAAHPGAVIIAPITKDKKLILIKQFRFTVEEILIEFPAGKLEPGEIPKETALREVREETGFGANKLEFLGELYPAPGFCDERQYLFAAMELYPSPLKPDDDEEIELLEVTPAEIEEMIKNQSIKDCKTIASYFMLKCNGLI